MRTQSDLRPALAASVGLHAAVVVAVLVALHLSPSVKLLPPIVPVTLVANIGQANERPAETASERRSASTPEPALAVARQSDPEPSPQMQPEPSEQPAPTPRRPKPVLERTPEPLSPEPRPAPRPKPIVNPVPGVAREPARPAPVAEKIERLEPAANPELAAARQPKPAQKNLDLGALAKTAPKRAANTALDLAALGSAASSAAKPGRADLDLGALADAPTRRSNATRGPSHAETDRTARQAAGAATSLTGDQLSALQAKIIPLWHPICDVQGATSVVVKVELRLDAGHQLASPPRLAGQSSSGASEDVMTASARRALTAVAQGAPYDMLPNTAPRVIIVAFHAKDACSGR